MSTSVAPAKQIERLARADGANPSIERDGGKFGAGIIRGVSLASVGEALGHRMWLDQTTIDQVAEFAAGKGEVGLKARFTHPGLSSDGLGRHLGRIFNVKVDGERAVGDLHLQASAHDTPDGDLAEYVMMLAEEDDRAAGLSIVFHHDFEAEEAFEDEHQEEREYEDVRGNKRTAKRFKSPDERNSSNYPHVRLSELRAADVVDEPAANPNGLFDRSPLAREADELLSYAAGISEKKPVVGAFDIDGDRANQFFKRWLESHGLSLVEKEPTEMADTTKPDESAPETRESILAEQKRFVDKFGAEDGVKWFTDGVSYEDALGRFADKQAEKIKSLESKVEEVEQKLNSIELGEKEPIDTKPGDAVKKRSLYEATKPSGN